jgi:outer membrane protein OmpA-like peptidoglycan-associated protein
MRFLIFLLTAINFSLSAQKTYWASNVIDFSSERTIPYQSKEYRAVQALGSPNKLPSYGDSYSAWCPATPDNDFDEYIKVGFDTAVAEIQQVIIAENLGQGTVSKIYLFDMAGKEHLVYENNASPSAALGRMLNVRLDKATTYKVTAVKLVLNTNRVKGWNQIDAIGVSQSIVPVSAVINLAKDAPTKVERENIGKGVNSRHIELSPVVSHDGRTLYFTRVNQDNFAWLKNFLGMPLNEEQDIYFSTLLDTGEWSKAQRMDDPINNKGKNSIFAVSADGREVLLINKYKEDGSMEWGISRSRKQMNGTWSFPEEVKIKGFNNDVRLANFTISSDGTVLVMSVQRQDTYGKRDLYVSFLQKDRSWSDPQNMGNALNTAETDETPFIAADGKTIYYSTKGKPGYGDGDVFRSKRLDDTWTKWSEPENLGPAINTPAWDGFFVLPASGEYAYVCSVNDSFKKDDIFRLKLPETVQPEPVAMLTGEVLDIANNKPLQAKLSVINTFTKRTANALIYNPLDGDFSLVLPLGHKYEFIASKPGYLPIFDELDLSKETKYREIRQKVYMMLIEKGQTMVLKRIQFEQGEYQVLPEGLEQINQIVESMKESPSMKILLEGHTDNQGEFDLNLKLSEDRVLAVKTYLVSKGIKPERIDIKGLGSTKPLDSNLTEDRRKNNRRVEITILEK